MKRFKYLLVVLGIVLSALLVGCNGNKITVGKYYAENNTESYIEILKNDEIVFVNIDFAPLEESLNTCGSSLSVVDVANKLSQPQKYDYYQSSSINGYDFTIQVLLDENTEYGEICLTLRWSKEKAIMCLDAVYSLNN